MFNVFLFGVVSLLADFSSEMVFPILPFFIQSLGGGGIAVGLIFGIGDAVAAIFKVISGRWADKTKKYKKFVFAGYLFSALAKFLYPFSQIWQHVVLIRPIERIGKGVRDAPRDAILSESLLSEKRGRAFGIQRAMDSAGAILGSIAVLIFILYFEFSFRAIFFISASIALFAVLPIFFVRTPENLKLNDKSVGFTVLSPKIKKFIFVATLFAVSHFSYAFFILRAQMSFGNLSYKETLSLAVLLYIFLSVFDASFSTFAGSLSDRIGRKKVILASYLMLSLVLGGFLLLSFLPVGNAAHFFILLIFFALYGLFRAFADPAQKSFVSDLSEVRIRGTALGTFETFTGLAAIPAGLVAGTLWNIGPTYTFAYGFALSLIASVLFAVVVKE